MVEPRPLPSLGSMVAFVGGALVVVSLFVFLGRIDPVTRRGAALVLSLGFEALGIAAMFLWRDKAAATAGVVVSSVVVLPVLILTFVDPKHPTVTFSSIDRAKGTLTAILLVGAAFWLVAYLFAPARRAGVFLAATLVAVWLTLLVQIATRGLDSAGQGRGFLVGDREQPFGNPWTKVGVVSLLVGLAYLAGAVLRDRAGDQRQATVLFGTAIPILTIAVLALQPTLHTKGSTLLALALAVIGIAAGTEAGRRFTSWYSGLAAVLALTTLATDTFGSSSLVTAFVMLGLGAGAAVGARLLEDA
ncbi:MAG: hypothetical protein JWM05_1348 [Acidimicrobiales bacterium]|nr:hypothetical protein [Acidimicrobiales bacterium]